MPCWVDNKAGFQKAFNNDICLFVNKHNQKYRNKQTYYMGPPGYFK